MYIGAIEGGGTKFIVAICDEKGNIYNKKRIETTDPITTLNEVKNYLLEYKIEALGISCFGPLDIDPNSSNYGMILKTPKKGWSNINLYAFFRKYFDCKIVLNTDVNAACLGEITFGSSNKLKNVLYMTVGTGIGVGATYNGKIYQTLTHSEMGHIRINKQDSDNFVGNCPFHNDCLEGLASGPALEKRYGMKAEMLDDITYDEMLKLEAYYLTQAIYSYCCILVPERIIIGGGVGNNQKLIELIKKEFIKLNNNYLSYKSLDNLDNFIITPSLGNESGIKGALALTL